MRKLFGFALSLIGVACMAWYGHNRWAASAFQVTQNAALDRALEHKPEVPAKRRHVPRQGLVGRLEIPSVGLSTVVVEGDDNATLRKSVGHLPDTALPWQRGNSAVAGHRDTFFRPLKNVKRGDEILFTTPEGVFRYRVLDTQITTPEDIAVLEDEQGSHLTLLTCYPFYYVGSAPKRYVVRAERINEDSRF